MSNRFHNKFHRHNHHTYNTDNEPDSRFDPIASPSDPFKGDFMVNGAISAYAPTSGYAGVFRSDYAAICAIGGAIGLYVSGVSHDNGNILINTHGDTVIMPDISKPAIYADGSVFITNALTANSVFVTNLYAASSVVTVTDMSITELSGFSVKGSDFNTDIPVSFDPDTHQGVMLHGVGVSGTSWASFYGDLRAGTNLYVLGSADIVGLSIMGEVSSNSLSSVNAVIDSLSAYNIYVPGIIAHDVITGVNAAAYIDLRTNSDFDGDDIAIVAGYRSSEDDPAGDLLLSAGYNDQMENYGDVVIQGSKITLQTEQSDQLVDINGTVGISNTITASNLSGTNTGDQDLSGFVPYTGASANVNLGDKSLSTSGLSALSAVIGGVSGYAEFLDDGTMVMRGNATTWRDEVNDALSIKHNGNDIIVNVGAAVVEISTSADLNDFLYCNVQLNHDRKLDADVHPHIHWLQDTADTPNLLLQYRWHVIGSAMDTNWTNYPLSAHTFEWSSGVIHQVTEGLAPVSPPSGSNISDIIQFKILRDNNNDSGVFDGTDTYTKSVSVMSFDIHVECDQTGSRQEYIK
jgi:hypothetical protein